jgi:predicted small lipoprotein YifL
MRWAILLASLTLSACGADGPPQPPQSGVAVSGEARVGVTGTL